MAFDADDEILQDFLVEAGEILEKLSEQLVDLEQHPDDSNLLNAIFRGFHTVKGGAGFLQLEALVNCCHSAENVFDILRNHKRQVDSELMDVVLEVLDHVNAMFEQVRNREELTPAPDQLIAALDALALPQDAAAKASGEPLEEPSGAGADGGDITDDEFEQLLDALHGETPAAGSGESQAHEQPAGNNSDGAGNEITDDEFEALLDELHGKGKFAAQEAPAADSGAAGSAGPATGSSGELISDDEFEKLLDELHGKGGSPTNGSGKEPDEPSRIKAELNPGPAKSKSDSKLAANQAPEKAAPAAPAREQAPVAETTVRVDTKRLDDIMNMVGELVLVRNRLQRLGSASEDEHMHKAVSSLDVVTTDLQAAVMQTRMQPIKKVFGRFPRVVRDLARGMNKEVNLVMHGEDTDLDKNLVEALSDPLVHLVRNSVDHGIEAPGVREKAAAGYSHAFGRAGRGSYSAVY